jgi:hypothetical protein
MPITIQDAGHHEHTVYTSEEVDQAIAKAMGDFRRSLAFKTAVETIMVDALEESNKSTDAETASATAR